MSYIYLASPYSHADPAVMEGRYQAALRAAATLMQSGQAVFAPIAHSHPISSAMPPHMATNHEFWMAQDLPLLRCAAKLVILKLPGWEQSRGIAEELLLAIKLKIPVKYMEPV